jgi:hypothetical protein
MLLAHALKYSTALRAHLTPKANEANLSDSFIERRNQSLPVRCTEIAVFITTVQVHIHVSFYIVSNRWPGIVFATLPCPNMLKFDMLVRNAA